MNTHRQGEEQETMAQASIDQYDVAILGGGIAGLTLALQLKKIHPTIQVLVVEKQKHPVSEVAHKVGESTVEIAAHYLRDVLGLEEHLRTQQLNKFGLRMFFSNNGNQDITRRVELGHATLPPQGVGTYQLDRGRLENALGRELRQRDIPFMDGCKVQQIILQPQSDTHCLLLQAEGGVREVAARWVVDASGRNTLLQRQLGLAKKVGHRANAVWFRIGYPININDWSSDPAWHARIIEGDRSLSTNHLMGQGYWVWLIRLASDSISIGIVTDASIHPFEEMNRFERALTWLHAHEPQCAAVVEQYRDKVQDFRVMKNYSYSCEQVFSSERWALTGEAGVSLDPLYSPGSDLIAISNGLITDLITRELVGEDITEQAAIHNQIYLILIESWLGIYQKQYSLMDNAQIMSAKVMWDTAVYWAIPGLLYFHDKLRRLADSPAVVTNLARFSLLTDRVQPFFREWYAIAQPDTADAFIRYYDFDFMTNLQVGMTAGLSDDELEIQFAANIYFLEQLAGQLVSVVVEAYTDSEDEAIQQQIQRWRADPYLNELISAYRQVEATNPINSRWITLGHPSWQRQEVAR
jgi:2-polyprenyl-6-methoxyphenol hydroxylase-like FAD-dependent oxidoreductase